jgi:hypothetical protein
MNDELLCLWWHDACNTLSPVTSLFPKGFHLSTVMDCLWRLLLEYAQAGRDLPSTDQHDIMPVMTKK